MKDQRKCPVCGSNVEDNAHFCTVCGAKLDKVQASDDTSDNTIPANNTEVKDTSSQVKQENTAQSPNKSTSTKKRHNRKHVIIESVMAFIILILLIVIGGNSSNNKKDNATAGVTSVIEESDMEEDDSRDEEITKLSSENSDLENKLSALSSDNDSLQRDNDNLQRDNNSLQSENSTLIEKVSNLNAEVSTLTSKVDEYENGAAAQLVEIKNAFEAENWKDVIDKAAKLHEKHNGSAEDSEAQNLATQAQAKLDEQAAAEASQEAAGYETGITYDQLARTPDDYMGSKVKFTGRVVQLIEGQNDVEIRLAVNDDYDTIVYCAYDPSIVDGRVLEDDMITVYGTSAGIISYQSTLGGKISIPGILVDKIEIQQ